MTKWHACLINGPLDTIVSVVL